MNRWAVIGVVGLGSVVLALVLFQRPDTGGAVTPAPAPSPVVVAPPPPARPVPAAEPLDDDDPDPAPAPPPFPPDRAATGPDVAGLPEGLAEARAWRSRPAALYGNRVMAPFSSIRYVLLKEGSPEARALADAIATGPVEQLRGVRTSEQEDPLTDMIPGLRQELARLEASEFAEDDQIAKSLDRIEDTLQEFEKVKASGQIPEQRPDARGEEDAP